MKLKLQQIDEKKFFALGKYAFLISAMMLLAGLLDNIFILKGIEIIKQLAMITFNFALMGYFAFMLERQKKLASEQEAEKFALKAAALMEDEPKPKMAKKYKRK